MSEIRFYLDENVSSAIARGLRGRGIDVLTTPEAGHMGWNDAEHLAFALTEGCVIVTQDDDFLALHRQAASHAGIAYYKPQTRNVKHILEMLLLIHGAMSPEEMRNHVEWL